MERDREYYAGQVIEAQLAFTGGDDVRSVIATFVNESDPDRIIRLVGDAPEVQSGVGGASYQTALRHKVAASDKPGMYKCVSLQAERNNGVTVEFTQIPNADRFHIGRESMSKPSGIGLEWRWG